MKTKIWRRISAVLFTVILCVSSLFLWQFRTESATAPVPTSPTVTKGEEDPALSPNASETKTQQSARMPSPSADEKSVAETQITSALTGDENNAASESIYTPASDPISAPSAGLPQASTTPEAVKTASAVNIGSDLQVFWDNYIVDSTTTNATLTLNSPQRKECVMTYDEPWEGDASDYQVLFYDDELQIYRMYYLGWSFENILSIGNSSIKVCYAESKDGITWDKPSLGLVSFNGSTDNNIVLMNNVGFDNFFVFKDTNPACKSNEKYKAVAEYLGADSYGTLHVYTSPDGFTWNDRGMAYSTNVGAFDSVNTCFYNAKDGYYYLYFRAFNNSKRVVKVVRSQNFTSWSATPVELSFTDDVVFELYTNNIQPYYRNNGIFVGFPTRYVQRNEWTDNFDELTGAAFRRGRMQYASRYGLAITDALFMTSRNCYTFSKFNEAWATPGPENGINWIYGDCYFTYGMIETPSDVEGAQNEISMYAFEGKWTGLLHGTLQNSSSYSTKLYRFTSRIDGFAGYKSTYAEQTVTTKPFTFTGTQLEMNFKTSAAGHIYVKVLDENGNEISGYTSTELFGDSTQRNVTFGSNAISALEGRTVKLQFVMSDASLFSFRFH